MHSPISTGKPAHLALILLGIGFLSPAKAQEPVEPDAKALPMRGFRFSSSGDPKESTPGETPSNPEPAAPQPGTLMPENLPGEPGNMKVGLVTELASLPPEVAEMAKHGALAVAEGSWEKARGIYLEMIKLAPDNALAYANLGVAEHQLGNLLAASGNLGKSLELNPHIARNWQTMGLISYERRELALAISCLTRAIHEDPEDPESRLLLAAVIRDYGWKEAAVTELQRAIELDPGQASAHYNLAVTYLDMKPPRLELARRHYYAAVDLGTTPSPEIEALFKDAE